MKTSDLSPMGRAYLVCALWSSTEDDGEPLDKERDLESIHPDSLEKAQKDCDEFREANISDIIQSTLDPEQVGHDFWLTRNGHGTGFWDRFSSSQCPQRELHPSHGGKRFANWDRLIATCYCPYHACERLSGAARLEGSSDAYIGDDQM